jgi:hypothetical protein
MIEDVAGSGYSQPDFHFSTGGTMDNIEERFGTLGSEIDAAFDAIITRIESDITMRIPVKVATHSGPKLPPFRWKAATFGA